MKIAVCIPLEPVDRLPTIYDTTDFRDIIRILGNELLQVQHVLAIHSPAAFHLIGNELPLLPDQEVHFQAVTVPEKVQLVALTCVISRFHCLHNNHILKEIAHERVPIHLGRSADAKKVRSKPDITEIDLWGLDYLAGAGCEPGPEDIHQMRCFKNGKPGTYCRATDSNFATQGGVVDQLDTPPREK